MFLGPLQSRWESVPTLALTGWVSLWSLRPDGSSLACLGDVPLPLGPFKPLLTVNATRTDGPQPGPVLCITGQLRPPPPLPPQPWRCSVRATSTPGAGAASPPCPSRSRPPASPPWAGATPGVCLPLDHPGPPFGWCRSGFFLTWNPLPAGGVGLPWTPAGGEPFDHVFVLSIGKLEWLPV